MKIQSTQQPGSETGTSRWAAGRLAAGFGPAVIALCLASSSAPAQWWGFGGGNANFTVPAIDALAAPAVLWSRELGFGNSGIVARDDTLYTMYRALDAAGVVSEEETVIALAAASGKTVWKHSYRETALPGQNDYGGGLGPHATPFVTDDHLFTLGYAGTLHCFDRMTGAVRWKQSLVDVYDATVVQFGFSASPVVIDGRLIVQAAGTQAGLVALTPGTGDVLWKSPAAGESYATPVLMRMEGEDILVFYSRDLVQGIRLEDGSVYWETELPKQGLTNVPTPMLLGDGRIFLAGQGVGGAMVIQVVKEGAEFRVNEMWRNTRVNFFHNSFIEQDGLIYGGSSFMYGMDVDDGSLAWTERGYELANLIGLGGLALLAPKDGRIVLAELNADGVNERHSIEVFETEAWAPPTVMGDRIYARDREALAALTVSGGGVGSEQWGFLAAKREVLRLAEQGDQGALVAQLQQWRQAEPEPLSASAQFRMAQQLADAESLSAATSLLRALIDIEPDSAMASAKLGRLLLVEGRREEALDVYRAAVKADPDFGEGARILAQLGGEGSSAGNVTFKLSRVRDGKLVTVAGSFNGWDPFHTFLRKNGSAWQTSIDLPPGEYEYKFVVDGNWMLDPQNPNRRSDGNNNVNSVLVVE